MKCALKIVVSPVLSILFSVSAAAADQPYPSQDLTKLNLKTGTGNAETLLRGDALDNYFRMAHKTAFLGTLLQIKDQKDRLEKREKKVSTFAAMKQLLPREFHRHHILSLAEHVGFASTDDAETRMNKFLRLGLYLKDVNDVDNLVSQKLELATHGRKLSAHEIIYFVTQSFEHAIALAESVDATIPHSRAIDFHLSAAQVLLWRLNYGRQSLLHVMTDFVVDKDELILDGRSKIIKEAIRAQLARVEALIDDPLTPLPVIYNFEVSRVLKSLTNEQKFELIKMHKEDMDAARARQEEGASDDLEQLRGLAYVEKNPLDYFTTEKIAEIKTVAREKGITEDELPKFIYNTMKNYSLKKVRDVEYYFTQEVVLRFLMREGLMTREDLAKVLREKMQTIMQSTNQVELRD